MFFPACEAKNHIFINKLSFERQKTMEKEGGSHE